ncbi:VOC family protein [Bacillus salitolerans]|uniref:VOC family protein n=1 Tax=Bacillus salitolerans TaxID=1437434 RepID=A0ABW4LQ33_9BACI
MNFHEKPNTFVNLVELKVSNLARSLDFYQTIIGLKVLQKTDSSAVLTVNGVSPLLTIIEPVDIIAKQPRTSGLYHFALLLPNRKELAKVFKHLIELNVLLGSADHLVSEALYLTDPDGNGIEMYADRPANTWSWENNLVKMASVQLDSRGILSELEDKEWDYLPDSTILGHIHLHVSNLEEAAEFYTNGLGFHIVSHYPQALFMSSGGYHHHIAINTWNGEGAASPKDNSVGLQSYRIVYPSEIERLHVLEQLHKLGATVTQKNNSYLTIDPSGNKIQLAIYGEEGCYDYTIR